MLYPSGLSTKEPVSAVAIFHLVHLFGTYFSIPLSFCVYLCLFEGLFVDFALRAIKVGGFFLCVLLYGVHAGIRALSKFSNTLKITETSTKFLRYHHCYFKLSKVLYMYM